MTAFIYFSLTTSAMMLAAAPLAAQTSSCNDMNRKIIQDGGPGPSISTPCAQVTFGGITTPASCLVSYRVTAANIYSCSGSLPNVNCDPFAFDIRVTVYENGACPGLPDFGDISGGIGDLLKIPGILISSLVCVAPTANSSCDPSANISPCGGIAGVDVQPVSGEVMINTGSSQAIWLDQAPTAASGTSFNPFVDWYEAAQDAAPGDLTGIFQDLAGAQAGMHGAVIAGSVTFEHFAEMASEPYASRQIDLSGSITMDGRFEIERAIPLNDPDGQPFVIHDSTYDGHVLLDFQERAEVGNAHELSASTPQWVRTDSLLEIDQAYRWLTDPYFLPMFAGLQTTEFQNPSPNDHQWRIQRHYPAGLDEEFLGEDYWVDQVGSVFLPSKRLELDAQGKVWTEDSYEDYFEMRSGDWRPRTWIHTRYLQGTADGGKVVTTTKIRRARVLGSLESNAVPATTPQAPAWYYWSAY